MTEEEWYFQFQTMAISLFEDFKVHLELLHSDNKKNYLFFTSIDDTSFLFKIGQNRLVLKYFINVQDLELSFKTFFIEPSVNHFGASNIKELEAFEFKMVHVKKCSSPCPRNKQNKLIRLLIYQEKSINFQQVILINLK